VTAIEAYASAAAVPGVVVQPELAAAARASEVPPAEAPRRRKTGWDQVVDSNAEPSQPPLQIANLPKIPVGPAAQYPDTLGSGGQVSEEAGLPGQSQTQLALVPVSQGGVGTAHPSGGTSTEMQIEQALVGYLIGKGGESLKAIQAQSGATLHVDQSTKDLGMSVIRISGGEQAVHTAKSLIERKVSEVKIPLQDQGGANAVAFEYHIDQSYVGFFIGRGGEQVKRIKAQTGATVVIDQSTKDLGYSIIRVMHGPGIDPAKLFIETRLEQAKEATLQNMTPGTAEELVIPQQLVGWVIGRSGESLRQIKQASGATLVLNQDTKSQGYSIVRFAGETEAVFRAKEMIKKKLAEVEGKLNPPQPMVGQTFAAAAPRMVAPASAPVIGGGGTQLTPGGSAASGNSTEATSAAIHAIASLLSVNNQGVGQKPQSVGGSAATSVAAASMSRSTIMPPPPAPAPNPAAAANFANYGLTQNSVQPLQAMTSSPTGRRSVPTPPRPVLPPTLPMPPPAPPAPPRPPMVRSPAPVALDWQHQYLSPGSMEAPAQTMPMACAPEVACFASATVPSFGTQDPTMLYDPLSPYSASTSTANDQMGAPKWNNFAEQQQQHQLQQQQPQQQPPQQAQQQPPLQQPPLQQPPLQQPPLQQPPLQQPHCLPSYVPLPGATAIVRPSGQSLAAPPPAAPVGFAQPDFHTVAAPAAPGAVSWPPVHSWPPVPSFG